MKNLGIILIALLALAAKAKTEFYNSQLVSKFKVDFVPTYFFKVDPSGQLISYTRDANSLWIYNVNKKTSVAVTGEYDPVFLPLANISKKFVFTAYRYSGVTMYSYDEPDKMELLFQDPNHLGLYESAGILSKRNPVDFTFRVMMQAGSSLFMIKDYSYNFKKNPVVTELFSLPQAVCPGLVLSMAILSKEGTEVIAYDTIAQKTKVFKIINNEPCVETENLGGIVGKGSFSYNGKYIAYHSLSSWVYNSSGYVKIPDGSVVGNIVLFDRLTKKHIPLTAFTEGTAMYPEFLANGDIIFVYYINGRAEFYRIKPDAQ